MMPVNFGAKHPLKILCLGAHCDDIEIGAGCTLLKIFQSYKIEQVMWVVFSSNEIRKKEAILCAQQFLTDIQNKKIVVHSFNDGFLPFQGAEIKQVFEELKSEISPDIIFTHFRHDRHQDHRLISDLTWNTWRNHFVLEYEIVKYDGDFGNPNFYVSVNENLVRKRESLLFANYLSQQNKLWFNKKTFRSLLHLRGVESATTFSEAFYARKIVF